MDELNKNGFQIKKGGRIVFRDGKALDCESVTVTPAGVYYISEISSKQMYFVPHSNIGYVLYDLEEKAPAAPPVKIPDNTPPVSIPGIG